MIRIDRCICFDQTFDDLKAVADEAGVQSIESLQEHISFGINCGLCRPYVARMLQTGQTLFREIIPETEAKIETDSD